MKSTLAVIGFVTSLMWAALASEVQATPAIVPLPAKMETGVGTFSITPDSMVVADRDSAETAQQLMEYLKPAMGFAMKLESHSPANAKSVITLTQDVGLSRLGKEGYRLLVTPTKIQIAAADQAGMFYGVQTLRQLLAASIYSSKPAKVAAWTVPCVTIEDQPRFTWRGLMLDSSRHFQSKEIILRFLDLMAMHKLNVFHWHLVDDHGWRLEIKRYPKLTSVGAWRKQPEYTENNGNYGGFYTQDDVRQIVAFAMARHITIVPEIEIPGHSQAAIAAYPELSCSGQPGFVEWFYHYPHSIVGGSRWAPNSCNVVCASSPKSREFLKDVLTETMALFPGKYIHIGGDEVDLKYWKACPCCRAWRESKHLKDDHQFQADLTGEIDRFLTEHGRHMIGWDEILQGGLTPGAAVMSWRGTVNGVKAAQAGHQVVMSPSSHLYFSRAAALPKGTPLPVFAPPSISLETVYNYDPVPAVLTDTQRNLILGAEACIWTEKYHTAEWLEMVAFPRLCALAEATWTSATAKNLPVFLNRMRTHQARLDACKVHYVRPVEAK
jgi:hexosaminidase